MNTKISHFRQVLCTAILVVGLVVNVDCYASASSGTSNARRHFAAQDQSVSGSNSNRYRQPHVIDHPQHLILSLSDEARTEMPGMEEPAIGREHPDYDGLRQDAYYFLGYQFFVVGLLYIAPQSVSGWTPEQKKNFTIQKYYNNVTDIVWDHDKLYVNYLLHPYWGMSYYIRARDRGVSESAAFGYAVLLSSLWEFGVEAMFEKVSIQDLFITPIVGSVVGKYVEVYRQGIKQKVVKSRMDNIMLGLTDPLGAVNRWVAGSVGAGASVSFSYSVFQNAYSDSRAFPDDIWHNYQKNNNIQLSPAVGLTFQYRL